MPQHQRIAKCMAETFMALITLKILSKEFNRRIQYKSIKTPVKAKLKRNECDKLKCQTETN